MDFQKTKDYLVCIDSDGCVIDSMTLKHQVAFGPLLLNHYDLGDMEMVTKLWNEINLYKITRGINRFMGLFKILKELNDPNYHDLEKFINSTDSLSNASLEIAIQKNDSLSLKKALAWSNDVNSAIKLIDKSLLKNFEGSKEALKMMKEYADVVVVSSANPEAIKEEWSDNNLVDLVNLMLSQKDGTKTKCIEKLLTYGYDRNKVLMIGDALGDFEAAKANQTYFYPILVGREKDSFKVLIDKYFQKFINLEYQNYEEQLKDEFYKNLE